MNLLIITADDLGLAVEVNEAVELAHRAGVLTAASLMVGGQAAVDAVSRARRLPKLSVGLHVVLVDGRPILPPARIPNLVDGSGNLRRDMVRLSFELALLPSRRRQLRAEIAAQFEAYRQTGLSLDHVDVHKHFHLHPVVAREVIAIGRQFGMRALRIPVEPGAVLARMGQRRGLLLLWLLRPWLAIARAQARRAGIVVADAVFGLTWSGAMSARRLASLIDNLPPGLIEIFTHPAVRNRFLGHADGYGYTGELKALCAPMTAAALRRSRCRLGSYGDVYPRAVGSREPLRST